MKKRFVLAALGLAAAAFAFGPTAAKADHCRSGYGYGSYYGGYRGIGIGGYSGFSGYRAVPSYRYGYRGVGGFYGSGLHHHHHHHGHGVRGYAPYYGGRGYGNSFFLRTPGFSLGIRR